ncbi:MAG: L-threonylcarbamoyladenylate synthase [Blastocatellia bacterium]
MTQVIQIDPEQLYDQGDKLERAASIIRNGGLVAFPTETVYGLGADALNEQAIQKIFVAKGRPADNPLIVHVGHRKDVERVAEEVSDQAWQLIGEFWPGPLTLVLKRKSEVPALVSSGLPTVAVRMPYNGIALSLIRMADTPIAAPSANCSGRPSPTSAAHVLADLDGRIEMILDGGATHIGIESTVLDMTGDVPVILRPGWITEGQIAAVVGAVERATSLDELQRSPGTRYRHYSPRARVVLIESGSPASVEQLCKEHLKTATVGFIGHTPLAIDKVNFHAMILQASAADYAGKIYAALRQMDERGAQLVIIEGISEADEGAAVMDRLRRAASEIV